MLLKDYNLKDIFKSITFDNRVEFSKLKNIEKYLKTKCCSDIHILHVKEVQMKNEYHDYVMNANNLINTKIRKILGYKSSLDLFMIELDKLTQLTT